MSDRLTAVFVALLADDTDTADLILKGCDDAELRAAADIGAHLAGQAEKWSARSPTRRKSPPKG